MYLSGDDVNKYPRCVDYMKNSLNPARLKKNSPKVWDAFLKACENEKWAKSALAWATNPVVVVTSGMLQGTDSQACGLYRPVMGAANMVQISSVRVIPFERCVYSGDLIKNARRFECTLLHELVHFVREMAQLNDRYDGLDEPGDLFEEWAYGKRLCAIDEIEDALLSYR